MSGTLPVIVEVNEIIASDTDNDSKGLFNSSRSRNAEPGEHKRLRIAVKEIPVEQLQENLKKFCGIVSEMLKDMKKDMAAVGEFKLTEVTVQVEVSAEGGIELIGTGKVGGKGAITLKFEG